MTNIVPPYENPALVFKPRSLGEFRDWHGRIKKMIHLGLADVGMC